MGQTHKAVIRRYLESNLLAAAAALAARAVRSRLAALVDQAAAVPALLQRVD
jgi:hypothetical protein